MQLNSHLLVCDGVGSLSDNFFYSPLHTRLLIRPVTFQFNFAYLSPRQEQIKLLRGRDDLRAVIPPAAAPAALSSAATRTPTSVERRLTEPTAVHYPRATDLRGRSWSVGGAVAHCCCLDFWMSMCGTFWCKSGRRPRQRGRKIAKMPGLGGRKNPAQFRSICRGFLFGSPSNSRFSFSFIGNLPSGQQQNIRFFSNSMNFHI